MDQKIFVVDQYETCIQRLLVLEEPNIQEMRKIPLKNGARKRAKSIFPDQLES